jgi:pyrophosphatase PpaX
MGHAGPPIRAVLFDVDGTLLDTREFILRAFEHAFDIHGLPRLPRDEMSLHVGRELELIYTELGGPEMRDRLVEAHRSFQARNLPLARPFAGAVEVLKSLAAQGVRVAAVTSRSRRTSDRSLEVTGLAQHLEVVISAEDTEDLKPHPAPLLKALRLLGHEGEGVVMVGDTPSDIEAGRGIGALTVAATYGFHGREVLRANPDRVIDDIGELPGILNSPGR